MPTLSHARLEDVRIESKVWKFVKWKAFWWSRDVCLRPNRSRISFKHLRNTQNTDLNETQVFHAFESFLRIPGGVHEAPVSSYECAGSKWRLASWKSGVCNKSCTTCSVMGNVGDTSWQTQAANQQVHQAMYPILQVHSNIQTTIEKNAYIWVYGDSGSWRFYDLNPVWLTQKRKRVKEREEWACINMLAPPPHPTRTYLLTVFLLNIEL